MSTSAARLLTQTLKRLQKEPIDGCCVEVDDNNLFEWTVFLEGPADSPYAGGIFKSVLAFPDDFPMSPPTMRFLSDMWHPNVHPDGKLCISILHPPGEDEMSGESAFERWVPVQTVETVLLSVISLLGEPNPSSPANVDAGVEWRNDRRGYIQRCRRLVEKANAEAPKGIVIPHPDTNHADRVKNDMPSAEERALAADYYYDYEDDYDECDYSQGEEEEEECEV